MKYIMHNKSVDHKSEYSNHHSLLSCQKNSRKELLRDEDVPGMPYSSFVPPSSSSESCTIEYLIYQFFE